jgi:hypothetical protein
MGEENLKRVHRPVVETDVKVLGTVQVGTTNINSSATANTNAQTIIMIQDDRARNRRVAEG